MDNGIEEVQVFLLRTLGFVINLRKVYDMSQGTTVTIQALQ